MVIKSINAIRKLTRIEHSFMLILAVFVSIITLNLQFQLEMLFYLILCPFLVSAGAFALNDYFDVETDRINKKKTPIVIGEISKNKALLISILFLLTGILLSLILGLNSFIIVLIFSILSIAYNYKLKDVALVGNVIISMSMAIVFIYTEVTIVNTISITTIFMCLVSFLAGLGREIYKTVQDMEGDKKGRESKTLPLIIGKNNSLHLGSMFIVLAMVCAVYMYLEINPMKSNLIYLGIVSISLILFTYSIKLVYSGEFEKVRKITLYSLTIGLISFLISGIF